MDKQSSDRSNYIKYKRDLIMSHLSWVQFPVVVCRAAAQQLRCVFKYMQ